MPKAGDRILIVKEHWLKLITQRKKTMEIRSRALRGDKYWLGYHGKIKGRVVLQDADHIKDEATWASLRDQHQVTGERLPYTNTWGLNILSASPVSPPIEYIHPKGAIGIVIYKDPVEEEKRGEKE